MITPMVVVLLSIGLQLLPGLIPPGHRIIFASLHLFLKNGFEWSYSGSSSRCQWGRHCIVRARSPLTPGPEVSKYNTSSKSRIRLTFHANGCIFYKCTNFSYDAENSNTTLKLEKEKRCLHGIHEAR